MTRKVSFNVESDDTVADDIEVQFSTGEVIRVWEPTSGQIALMLGAFSEDSESTDSAHAILQFFKNITEPEGYRVVKDFLANPAVPNSLEQLVRLTNIVIEEFTGNPTKQPADYLPSRRGTGQSSTAQPQRRASTRARSPRAASATSSTRSSSPE